MMDNSVTGLSVIATCHDSWLRSNLSAPGLKQEGQNLKLDTMLSSPQSPIDNFGDRPLSGDPYSMVINWIPAFAGMTKEAGANENITSDRLMSFPNVLIENLKRSFLCHSEEKRSFYEESKNEILRLRLRMTNRLTNIISSIDIVSEKQFEQQVEAVKLFEHYI